MAYRFSFRVAILIGTCVMCTGCVGPSLEYESLTPAKSDTASAAADHPDPATDVAGYAFVIPRTVLRVELSTKNGDQAPTFTPVPIAFDPETNKQLKTFLAIDDSRSPFGSSSTAITNVTYVDNLVISSIGTQVTDNRKDLIADIVAIAGKVLPNLSQTFSYSASGAQQCTLQPFVLKNFTSAKGGVAPNNTCWGVAETLAAFNATGEPTFSVGALPLNAPVNWFPIPACKNYRVTVYLCGDGTKCRLADAKPAQEYSAVVAISDGQSFQRVELPSKGKIALRADFCGADITNDTSSVSSGWSLLNDAISDVKALQGSGSSKTQNAKP